jgi:hypothetical protein
MSIFLILLLLLWLDPPMGYRWMVGMSSSSTFDLAHGSSETQAPSASLFFLGLPLLRVICCWGDETSTIFPPYTILFISGSMQFDLIASMGKGITCSMTLGMMVTGEKKS